MKKKKSNTGYLRNIKICPTCKSKNTEYTGSKNKYILCCYNCGTTFIKGATIKGETYDKKTKTKKGN